MFFRRVCYQDIFQLYRSGDFPASSYRRKSSRVSQSGRIAMTATSPIVIKHFPKKATQRWSKTFLNHPNIHVLLNTDYKEVKDSIECEHTYYSGSIDEYYDYCYGKLPYRSVTFKFETHPIEEYQSVSVVNYPNNYDYTRITEFKHFYHNKTANMVIAKEIPGADGDPSYPIPTNGNKELYSKYVAIPNDQVTFIGRLGEYKYYSMDQIVEKALRKSLYWEVRYLQCFPWWGSHGADLQPRGARHFRCLEKIAGMGNQKNLPVRLLLYLLVRSHQFNKKVVKP